MRSLIEGSLILTSAFAFNFLQYIVWVKAYEENLASYRKSGIFHSF